MKLDFIKPIVKYLPEVKTPERAPTLNEKLIWTGVALVAFFIMYSVTAVGVKSGATESDFLQTVTASRYGSLLTTGIGPIVLASIFLQLFAGAKIIEIDLSDPEQRATFHGAQKILAILLCFFEAALFVLPWRPGGVGRVQLLYPDSTFFIIGVIFQIAMGSLILLYLDEVVSKYGIGSGISLFIAAGVSLNVIGGTFALLTAKNTGVIDILSSGTAEALPNALLALSPLFFTFIVFLVVVYAEGMKVEIPLAFERARGLGGRFPIKFLYVSNIPVILASALLLNMQFFAAGLAGIKTGIELFGHEIMHFIAYSPVDPQTGIPVGYLSDGLIYLISPSMLYFYTKPITYIATVLFTQSTSLFGIPEWVHAITYVIFMVILCVIFGEFWVETADMGPRAVAEQLNKAGMQIPGYRRDPRVIEKILERYIPTITILGSAFVGLLAALADLTGALGTGTGILLTVGIVNRMYEDLSRERLFEMHPGITQLLGEK